MRGDGGRCRVNSATSRSTEETPQEVARLLKAYATKTYYKAKKCPKALRRRGIKSKIARKCKERGEKLGQHR